MPTVTLIGRKKDPDGMTVTLPTGGKTYHFQKGKEEKNIPDRVAEKCLRINNREGYLKFRVEGYPSDAPLKREVDQNVHGEVSPVKAQKVKEPEKAKAKSETKTKKKKKTRKVVQGSL